MLHTAGIVGMRPDGSVSEDVGDQAGEVWRSIGILLEEAGFEPADVVSYTTYVLAGEALTSVVEARDRFFGEHRAASVLVTVPALAHPQWKVEVSVIAARTD
jgi:2-iminobutanoate/2-iminopropanoate deaminase